jgi:hypothetical protein
MNQQEMIQFKLKPALKECEQHQAHLQSAWKDAVAFPALQSETKDITLTDSQIRTLDQLIFRFGKLQDAIGTRLLPALLQLLQEWQDNEAFLDKLNRAEKLGLLVSVEQWQWLREIRNQTTHEYPDNPEFVIIGHRRLVAHVPMLLKLYEQLTKAAADRFAVA